MCLYIMGNNEKTFNFSINDVRSYVIKAEQELRDLIYSILTEKYGISWEVDPQIGFKENEKQDLMRRKEEEMLRFPNQTLSDRLIDYCYIHDLKNILQKNWQHFGQIFSSKEKTCVLLEILSLIRNPIMHGRNDIVPHQFHLCIGICGDFLNTIERWKLGYKVRIKSFECEFKFSSLADVNDQETAKLRSLRLAEGWIQKIISSLDLKPQYNSLDENKSILLRLSYGKIRIHLINNAWWEQYDKKQYWNISVRVETNNYDALDRVLSIENHPYWTFTMKLEDQLDLAHIKRKAEEVVGHKQWRIGGQLHKGKITPHAIDDLIGRSRDTSVFVKLYSGQQDSGSSLQIICKSDPNHGFHQAHKVFMVKDILSILNGQMTAAKTHELIRRACTI